MWWWEKIHELEDHCVEAPYISQFGDSCAYYAVLIPLFWSKCGIRFMKRLLEHMVDDPSPVVQNIMSYCAPTTSVGILRKYMETGELARCGTVQVHQLPFHGICINASKCTHSCLEDYNQSSPTHGCIHLSFTSTIP
jgi:hypothetical protein